MTPQRPSLRLRHWFTGKALADAVGFAIGFFLTVVSVAQLFVNWFLVLLGLIGASVLGVQWRASARQNRDDEQRQKDNEELLATVRLLATQTQASPTPVESSSVENLSRLSNAELRKRVSHLAKSMRAFEAGSKLDQSRWFGPGSLGVQTPEQQDAEWQARTNQLISQATTANSEFRSRFLPEGKALRKEMSQRLGLFPPYAPNHRTVALDYGALAGVAPVSDAADYLEELARALPD